MKRSTLLKLAFVIVAMFAFMGTYAQVQDGNLVEQTAGQPANQDTVTVGYQTIYVAKPDTYYHPNYTAVGLWTLTANFTWAWTYFAADGTTPLATPADYSAAAGAKANEILVTWANTGDYVLKVAETAPAAWGGCQDATPSVVNVAVVAEPSRGTFPYFNTTLGMASGDTHYFCGDQGAVDINVNLTGFPKFNFEWTLVRQEIDEAGLDVGAPTTLVNNITAGAGAQVLGAANGFADGNVTNQTYVLENRALTMIGGTQRTKYTYTMMGMNDLYSRKSDYVAGTTSWFPTPAANETYIIVLNPTPNTGPIYHVPNNWGAI